MAAGVEVRVPFLDKNFLDVSMSIHPEHKMCGAKRIEKSILREAFRGTGHLPDDVLFRQKEQFSDGVGYIWIDSLKERAEVNVRDTQMLRAKDIFPFNTPTTKEAYFYRTLFSQLFPSHQAASTVPGGPSIACSSSKALEWDAAFKANLDQSGRSVLDVHHNPNQSAHPHQA
eukprot:GHVN01028388.1.p1 GENE.GHVN01028388.1~~GHVN01028388.1.p1  ORF type:complete len:172 (-),score=25.02 GHVN01028388.1:1335-1850(-)